MGEDLAIGAIRDMMNPWTYNGNPGKVSDWQWQTDQNSDAGGSAHEQRRTKIWRSHSWRMAELSNGRTVTAIGLQAGQRFQYRAPPDI